MSARLLGISLGLILTIALLFLVARCAVDEPSDPPVIDDEATQYEEPAPVEEESQYEDTALPDTGGWPW